jgi:hypothetical protein
VSVTRLASPSLVVARARPTERMIRLNRHFWAAKTCSMATRTRARLTLPRTMCGGIGLPRGLGRWNCGTSPRRASQVAFAAERWAVSAQTLLAVMCGSSSLASWRPVVAGGIGDDEAADEAMPTVDAEVVLITKDRDHELGPGRRTTRC